MAVGALIGAYQEDDAGGLRALLPLAGRSLIEFQVRSAAAAGASPIIVQVERIPPALNEAFERLRGEGYHVIVVSDAAEAASRFEPGALILLVADGVVAAPDNFARITEEGDPAVAVVPDDEEHEEFERIDATSRWGGLALVDGRTLSSTVAMLGDWDLQSTLLRRAIQEGARRVALEPGNAPLLASTPGQLGEFERGLFASSRGQRPDWVSRYALGWLDDIATAQLASSRLRPEWLVWLALALTVAAAFSFTRGWLAAAMAMLVASTPLDQIGQRLGSLRLQPLPARMLSRRLLWPTAGVALVALGWRLYGHGSGWGAFMTALVAAAFAEAARIERGSGDVPGAIWLFSRRNAIVAFLPFALFSNWTGGLIALALYAASSFFLVQHVRHTVVDD